MRNRTRLVAGLVALVVVAVVVVMATQIGSDPRADAKTSRLAGGDVPEFTVRTLDGTEITEASLAGRATIVNFWNTWCVPCVQEQPALDRFGKSHADDDSVTLLAVVRDDTRRAVEDWVASRNPDWTVAMDPGGQAALAFGTRGQPETFALSPDGVVVAYQFGPASVADLETMLRAARGA